MRGTYGLRTAALALAAAAAFPALALAGEGNNRPQEQARVEQWIEQAIRGDAAAPAAQSRQAVRPAEPVQAARLPPAGKAIPGR